MRWSGRQSSTALSLRSPFAMRAAIGAYVVGCAIATAVEPARQAQGTRCAYSALWFEQLSCVGQVGLRKAHIRRRMHACTHACTRRAQLSRSLQASLCVVAVHQTACAARCILLCPFGRLRRSHRSELCRGSGSCGSSQRCADVVVSDQTCSIAADRRILFIAQLSRLGAVAMAVASCVLILSEACRPFVSLARLHDRVRRHGSLG